MLKTLGGAVLFTLQLLPLSIVEGENRPLKNKKLLTIFLAAAWLAIAQAWLQGLTFELWYKKTFGKQQYQKRLHIVSK